MRIVHLLAAAAGALGASSRADAQPSAPRSPDVEAAIAAGRAALDRNDLVEALSAFSTVLERFPEDVLALQGASTTLILLTRHSEALALLDRLAKLRPGQGEVFGHRGTALLALGRGAEAETDLRRAIALKPDYAPARAQLGVHLRATGRVDEAIEVLDAASKSAPDHAVILAALGETLAMAGRDRDAEGALRASLDRDGGNAEGRFRLGTILHRTGRAAEAVAEWERAVRDDPAHRGAWYSLARARAGAGDPEGSRLALERFRSLSALEEKKEELEKRVRGHQGGEAVRVELAEIYVALGKPQAALGQLLSISSEPALAERAIAVAGRANLRLGRHEFAIRALERARTVWPGRVDLRLDLARAYLGAGRRDAARAEVAAALAIDPRNTDAASLASLVGGGAASAPAGTAR